MQPSATLMQMITALSAVSITAIALTYTVHTWSDDRNARLVEIGVGVLKTDPKDDNKMIAARQWALDLIDSNAGGVKFTEEARKILQKEPLEIDFFTYDTPYYYRTDPHKW